MCLAFSSTRMAISNLKWEPPVLRGGGEMSASSGKRVWAQQPVSGLRRSDHSAFCAFVFLPPPLPFLSPSPCVFCLLLLLPCVCLSLHPLLSLPSSGSIAGWGDLQRAGHLVGSSLFLLRLPSQGYLFAGLERCCYSWWCDCIATQQRGAVEEERQGACRQQRSASACIPVTGTPLLIHRGSPRPCSRSPAAAAPASQTWWTRKVGHDKICFPLRSWLGWKRGKMSTDC